jgi:hypothetical protein
MMTPPPMVRCMSRFSDSDGGHILVDYNMQENYGEAPALLGCISSTFCFYAL